MVLPIAGQQLGHQSHEDDSVPIKDVPKHVPGRRKPHKSTIHRWWTRGVKGVKLKTFMVAGRRHTRLAWLDEFLRTLNDAAGGASLETPNTVREQARRQSEIDRAERELAEAGA